MKAKLPCCTLDPDLWFPVGTIGPALHQAEQAKAMCKTRCPITDECLDRALRLNAEGIWGGTDQDERRLIRANRKQAATPVAHAG